MAHRFLKIHFTIPSALDARARCRAPIPEGGNHSQKISKAKPRVSEGRKATGLQAHGA